MSAAGTGVTPAGQGQSQGGDAGAGSGAGSTGAGQQGQGETQPPADWAEQQARMQRTIEAQRQAERDAKRRADEAEAALKAIRDKDLPEAEKLKQEVEALRQERAGWEKEKREQAVRAEVLAQATTLRFRDPPLAVNLVNLSALADADGKPHGVVDALKTILKDHPYLGVGAAGGDAGEGGTAGSGMDMNSLIRRATGR